MPFNQDFFFAIALEKVMDPSEAPSNDASAAHTQQTLDGSLAAADEIHRENANHTWVTFRAKARELKYPPSTIRGVWEDYKKIVENAYTDSTLALTASHILHECKDDHCTLGSTFRIMLKVEV